jgi:hypothetical protein
MADVNRFSERLIDASERFADVVDAAQGKGSRKSGFGARWLVLPAVGAAAYALATSTSSAARRTRKLLRRATDLPDADLIGRVKEVTGAEQSSSSSSGRSQSSNSRSKQRRSGSTTRSRRRTSSTSR